MAIRATEHESPPWKPNVTFAPGITLRSRDEQRASDFQADMLRGIEEQFDRKIEERHIIDAGISWLHDFLRGNNVQFSSEAVRNYVEAEVQQLQSARHVATPSLVARALSKHDSRRSTP